MTNSLLIRASQQDYDVLRQAVEQVDIRPLQVLIEVLIVEARHDRTFSLGRISFVPPQSVDRGDGTADATSVGGGLGDLVVRLLNLGHRPGRCNAARGRHQGGCADHVAANSPSVQQHRSADSGG